jgi:hypothetical protein
VGNPEQPDRARIPSPTTKARNVGMVIPLRRSRRERTLTVWQEKGTRHNRPPAAGTVGAGATWSAE